ncbi:MAG TPA: tetratricopeptide repeat protein [Polyangiaceae bacterium]|nr:tetratricopeptide repeat protein [Polyangiaceae bacterium]
MSELKTETRALLDLGRAGDDPSDDSVDRNRRRLALKIGAAALGAGTVAGSTTSAAAMSTAGAWASTKVLALCGTLLVGGIAAGAYTLRAERAAEPVASAPRPVAVVEKNELTPPAAVAPEPAPVVSAEPGPPARATAPARSIQSELELIRAAQKHLHRSEARAALSLLADHARRYPAGALSEEREASRVFALCQLGDVAAARTQAERFLRRSPNSPFAERVRASCSSPAR